jgi:hypothetical protein
MIYGVSRNLIDAPSDYRDRGEGTARSPRSRGGKPSYDLNGGLLLSFPVPRLDE